MTLLQHPNSPERLECGPENDRRIYHLASPSVLARAQWRKAVVAAGGMQYGPRAMLAALRDGVAEILAEAPEEARAAIIARLDRHCELLDALADAVTSPRSPPHPELGEGGGEGRGGGKIGDAGADAHAEESSTASATVRAAFAALVASEKSLTTIELSIAEGYPRYAAMLAADRAYDELAGIVGARMFLVAWEGFSDAVVKDRSGVTEACLAQIPEEDFRQLGMKLRVMTRLSPEQRKNSKSPASSPSAGKISSNTAAKNGSLPNSDSDPIPNTRLN